MSNYPDVLNLDEIVSDLPSLRLNGQVHTMRQMTVKDYAHALKVARKAERTKTEIEEGGEENDEKAGQATVDMLVESITMQFPNIKDDAVRDLPMVKIDAIFDLIAKYAEEEEARQKKRSGKDKAPAPAK